MTPTAETYAEGIEPWTIGTLVYVVTGCLWLLMAIGQSMHAGGDSSHVFSPVVLSK